MIRREQFVKKHQIISEYLSGTETLKSLGEKYNINLRTIQSWVRAFRKSQPSLAGDTQEDIKLLKRQLEEIRLKNELLEELLKLSEEQTGIELRKKYGTRQS